MIEHLFADLRYAARVLLRSPGFSFIAIATMALGIGATTAIYSVIDATLLHPLPYPNSTALMHVADDLLGTSAKDVGLSIPELRDLESSGIFQSVSIATHGASTNLTGGAQPEHVTFKLVTPNYFAVLGVGAQLGHAFNPRDVTPGVLLQVVISDGLWRRQFDYGRAAAPRCAGGVVEKVISGGLPNQGCLDRAVDSAQRKRDCQRSPITRSLVRRGRIGAPDQLRQRRQSAARQGQRARS